MSSYNNNFEGHQGTTCYPVEGRVNVAGPGCLIKGHLRFDPDHHDHQQSSTTQQQHQSSGRLPAHLSTNSLPNSLNNLSISSTNNMQHFTDDLYPLEPLYQQPQHQQHFSYPQQQQQWIASDFVPVQRQVPSTRAYSYQPYPSSSPRISHYVSPTTPSPWEYSLLDYSAAAATANYDTSCFGSAGIAPSLCADSHSTTPFASHGLYAPSSFPINGGSSYPTYGLFSSQQQQQAQQFQQQTCIAPEDLFARMPMTPISPASLEDSDDRASSPSSADTTSTGSDTPLSARSSPTRPGLQIPTVPSLSLSTSSIAPSWTSSTTASSSSLPSPVDSLSSASSHDEPAFVPTASLKKSAAANSSLKAKRATRSAAPEPAWVEAVLAEDAKRLQMDAASAINTNNAGLPRPANRPIAFACVFCRHRKIQCIRPKTEVAPGEKPAPCNQCEKRNRCCEYPPAALNPRIGRRTTRPSGGKNED